MSLRAECGNSQGFFVLDRDNIGFGWALLNARERKIALSVLLLGILNAISSVLMVGSIFPFLSVLIHPSIIHTNLYLSWAYQEFDFKSENSFSYALAIATVVIILVSTVIQILNVYAIEAFSSKLIHSLGKRLLSLYLQQPYEYFLSAHSEKMSAGILTEVGHVVNYFIQPIAQLWSAFLTCFAILVLLAWANPIVAGLAIIILGGAYCVTFVITQVTVKRLGVQRTEANEAKFLVTKEVFSGIKDVKVLGRESNYLERFSERSIVMAKVDASIRIIAAVPKFIIHTLAMCGVIGLCLPYIGSAGHESGESVESVLPVFGLFAFASQRLIPSIQAIFASLTQMQYGAAAVSNIHADFQLPPAQDTHWDAPASVLGLKKEIRLENIGFDYSGASNAGLSEITFAIKAGERIGIVGGTGAGKTTLVDIILGLLSPQKGQIIVDGQAISSKNLRAWQRSVGYVPQDIFLTNASIAENIAFGVLPTEIDFERVVSSARSAEIDAFINDELPEGYNTEVGERGVRLSGGQRQRVGVARALYRDADLIVFDEATSALDNVTERAVMNSLESLHHDKTVIIIAHRLSTIKFCDRVLVMDSGRVTGLGSFEDLLQNNKTLRALDAAGHLPKH